MKNTCNEKLAMKTTFAFAFAMKTTFVLAVKHLQCKPHLPNTFAVLISASAHIWGVKLYVAFSLNMK